METTYFGIKAKWYHGDFPGPWLMTDQENNLVGCVNEDPNDKYCETLESINWRFVTQMVDGEPHHWRSMGGNAQEGELSMLYDGGRIRNERSSYDPMRKQGAIILGNGGDNGNVSSGTFYEGAMTLPVPSRLRQQTRPCRPMWLPQSTTCRWLRWPLRPQSTPLTGFRPGLQRLPRT